MTGECLRKKNRRLVDSISDYLFTPTLGTKQNLLREGHPTHKIFRVGKPVYDVLNNFKKEIDQNKVLEKLQLEKKDYFLVTAHRPENVGFKRPLKNIIESLNELHKKYEKDIIFPIHPRTRKSIKKFGIKLSKGIRLFDPVGFLEFSKLEKKCILLCDRFWYSSRGLLYFQGSLCYNKN